MVAIKTGLALPSLSKSVSSRNNSPLPTPTVSEEGEKRAFDALPRSRSRSGDGSKRSGVISRTSTPNPGLTPGLPSVASNGGSATSALRPKFASLLTGRTASQTSTPQTLANGASTNGGPATPHQTAAQTPAAATNGSVAINSLEASYVSKVGIRLNDAVNKTFPAVAGTALAGAATHFASDSALVTYKGLCAPRVDRAREVGQIIASELHLAINDPYLLRSLLRSAVLKSLSILLSRLESLMISPSSDPSVLSVAKTLKEAENPPLSQKFSFMILRSAWELKKGLLRACGSVTTEGKGGEEPMPKFVKDTLAPWITKVDLLAGKIFNPILAEIKAEATKIIVDDGLQESTAARMAVPSHVQAPSGSSGPRSLSLTRASATAALSPAPSATSALAIPAYLRDLSSLLTATSRTFAWLSIGDSESQKWKVSIGSLVIWKMLLTLSSRRIDVDVESFRRRVTPPLQPTPVFNGNGHITVGAAPGPRRSMSAMGMGRLRSGVASGKRSPSPPASAEGLTHMNAAKLINEMEIFESILEKFVATLLEPGSVATAAIQAGVEPCKKGKTCECCRNRVIPLDLDDSDDEEALPREAMQEAMTALSSFIVILRAFASSRDPVPTFIAAVKAVDDLSLAPEVCPNLIRALDTIPPLILLQVVQSRIPRSFNIRAPHELWSTTWKDYELTMKGFHTGDEWVGEVGWELLKEGKRSFERLVKEEGTRQVDDEGWLELLRLSITELAEVDDLDGESESGFTVRSNARN